MKTIYKYEVRDNHMVWIPRGAKILTAALQNEIMYVWALIDTAEKENELRQLHVFATGQEIQTSLMTYITTVHKVHGWMVFHVFQAI